MKKKLSFIFMVAVMAAAMSMPSFAFNWTQLDIKTEIRDFDGDGEYEYRITRQDENGNLVRNQWVRLNDKMGVNFWMYFGDDGYALTDTTTPDGYTVNEKGEWYQHSPGAVIVDVDDYNYENAYYPFSYDGSVVKNEYLGISCQYTAQDAQDGYQLAVMDSQDSMQYSAFSIAAPDGSSMSVSIVRLNEDLGKTISDRIEFYNSIGSNAGERNFQIAGKQFQGYVMDTYTGTFGETKLFRMYVLNADGTASFYEAYVPSEERMAEFLVWLDGHFAFSK